METPPTLTDRDEIPAMPPVPPDGSAIDADMPVRKLDVLSTQREVTIAAAKEAEIHIHTLQLKLRALLMTIEALDEAIMKETRDNPPEDPDQLQLFSPKAGDSVGV